MERPIRVYVDTSVFGGVFDKEFEEGSRIFFERVRAGEFTVVISSTVSDELHDAPEAVRAYYLKLAAHIEVTKFTLPPLICKRHIWMPVSLGQGGKLTRCM